MVDQRPFVEIHRLGARRPREEMARELQHVVGIAGLRAFSTEVMRGLLFREEGFAVAVPAGDERPVVHDAIPEEQRDVAIAAVAGQLIFAGDADNLRESGCWRARCPADRFPARGDRESCGARSAWPCPDNGVCPVTANRLARTSFMPPNSVSRARCCCSSVKRPTLNATQSACLVRTRAPARSRSGRRRPAGRP